MDRKRLISAIADRDIDAIGRMLPVWHVLYKEGDVYTDDYGNIMTAGEYLQKHKDPRFDAIIITNIN